MDKGSVTFLFFRFLVPAAAAGDRIQSLSSSGGEPSSRVTVTSSGRLDEERRHAYVSMSAPFVGDCDLHRDLKIGGPTYESFDETILGHDVSSCLRRPMRNLEIASHTRTTMNLKLSTDGWSRKDFLPESSCDTS